MRNWKKFWRNFKVILLLLLPLQLIPCGPVDRSFHGYTFVDENILKEEDREAMGPLLHTFESIYAEYFEKKDSLNLNSNLLEWQERVCGWATIPDISFIVYKSSISDLQLLLTNTESKNMKVPNRLRGNTFAEYLWESDCTGTIDYLIFAKRCEPHVTVPEDQWQVPPRNVEAMKGLIAEGQKLFRRAKSDYMKLRLAYQIVRLAHYAGEYQQAVDLYEKMLPKIDKTESKFSESIIPWWMDGHYAGALLKLGRRAEASYLYAKIFQNCPGRRMSAYRSFSIRSDEEWEACIRLCQSDTERAMLYAIRAANPKSKAVDEMESIYRLDPHNPQLEILLVQEMKKIERSLLGLKWNSHRTQNKARFGLPEKGVGDYVISLQAFTRKVRAEEKVPRPALWRIAEGYLEFLAGDFYAAEKTYREAALEVGDDELKKQLEIFRLALKIAQFDKPSPEVETAAYGIMKDVEFYKKYRSFPDYLRDKLTYLYENSGNEAKAFLCQKTIADLRPNPAAHMVDELLAISQKADKTNFERLLMDGISTSDLLDMKAIRLLAEGQVEAAMEIYKRIPATDWEKYGRFNPFKENFHDQVNLEDKRDSLLLTASLNRGELIDKLLELEYLAKGEPDKAPRHYYRLGLAWYNMSYYGYEWRAMDYFRSGSSWSKFHRGTRGVYPHWEYPVGNAENTDVSRALFFFEKARLLAKTPELKAKATFQAARCEQKLYFISENYRSEPCCNNIPRLPEEYRVNFSRLKEEYAETEFYEWIIEECLYFDAYVNR